MHIHNGLVFGLDWQTAVSEDKKELKQLNKSKAQHYVESRNASSLKFGFGTVPKKGKFRSAAAIFASIVDGGSGIFIHQIDRENACFIAVLKSVPVAGQDLVGSRAEMIAAANQFLTAFTENDIAPSVFGDITPDEFSAGKPLELSKLVSETNGSTVLSEVDDTKLWHYAVPATLVLGALAFFAPDIYDYFVPPPPPAEVDPIVTYRAQRTEKIKAIVAENKFPSDVLAGFMPFLESGVVPWYVAGWQMTTLNCKDTDCTATWQRKPGGTVNGFLDALHIQKNDKTVLFPGIDLIQRKLTFSKQKNEKKLFLIPNAAFADLVGSWLQEKKDKGTQPGWTVPSQIIVPPPGVKLEPGDVLTSGSVTIDVPWRDLPQVAKLPAAMTIDEIHLTAKARGEVVINFTGKYYAL